MEEPVPDLIYYQRIVDNNMLNDANIIKDELQELINDVKDYIAAIAKKGDKNGMFKLSL